MQLPAILSLATLASGAALDIVPRNHNGPSSGSGSGSGAEFPMICPPEFPVYCGWFDGAASRPPQCLPTVPTPQPMPQPVCPRGTVAYCALDPGHWCPYDPAHEFCAATGAGTVICIDIKLQKDGIVALLGELFCLLDKALEALGLACLLPGGVGQCPVGWQRFDLACTVEELVELVQNGLCIVFSLVSGLLGGLFGGH